MFGVLGLFYQLHCVHNSSRASPMASSSSSFSCSFTSGSCKLWTVHIREASVLYMLRAWVQYVYYSVMCCFSILSFHSLFSNHLCSAFGLLVSWKKNAQRIITSLSISFYSQFNYSSRFPPSSFLVLLLEISSSFAFEVIFIFALNMQLHTHTTLRWL